MPLAALPGVCSTTEKWWPLRESPARHLPAWSSPGTAHPVVWLCLQVWPGHCWEPLQTGAAQTPQTVLQSSCIWARDLLLWTDRNCEFDQLSWVFPCTFAAVSFILGSSSVSSLMSIFVDTGRSTNLQHTAWINTLTLWQREMLKALHNSRVWNEWSNFSDSYFYFCHKFHIPLFFISFRNSSTNNLLKLGTKRNFKLWQVLIQ